MLTIAVMVEATNGWMQTKYIGKLYFVWAVENFEIREDFIYDYLKSNGE